MTQVNGFKGFVGYGIRELNLNETNMYCLDKIRINPNIAPMILNQTNFTKDFMLRSYTTGCYFYDVNTGKWSPNGMDIYYDTNLQQTHCLTHHLTSFAGGFVPVSSTINFQYAFANSSFTKNPLIYFTVIIVSLLYVLFAIWALFMDRRDLKKLNIVPLKDNFPNENYFYELLVFTGNRSESETRSKVNNSFFTI